jgi:hypothetical protein
MVIERNSGAPLPGASNILVEQIRSQLHEILQDCKDIRTQQLIYQINLAQTPSDLWVLRIDMQQCITQLHGPAIAIERIDRLISIFEG